jgi:hypothetical protein
MFRLSFYPIADSFLLVLAAALVLLLLLLAVGPGRRRLSRGQRAALVALRAGVIVLLVLAMLRPTLVYTEIKKQSATLVVLADRSRSMSVRDAVNGRGRWEALRKAVSDAAPALNKLARDFELKAYSFDAEIHPLQVSGGKIPLEETPEGTQTAIGAALEDVLQQEAGKRLLGVILLSDGAQRALAPRDRAPQTAAARLKHLGYPLFTFAFGQSRGLGQAQDVAVKELLVGQDVFVKNELAVSGQVRLDGYVNRDIDVRLLFETSPGKMEVVRQEKVKATADGQLLPVKLSYVPEVPGEFKVTLEAVQQPGELVTTNNQLSTFVHVLKGGLSVLYLEGGLRPEIGSLRRALDASRDIHVAYRRIDPRHSQTRPGDLPEAFRPGKYEVYILSDLDATAFHGSELKDLAEAVNRGAGLIMLGGEHSFGPGGYASTPLAEVLPVRMAENERQRFEDPTRPDVHVPGPLKMRPTARGLLHPALMLGESPQENAALWAKLPPFKEGANRFRPSGLAAGAEVLADAGESVPLLVAHNYGNGRVLAFAADSTWHWWMRGFQSAHKRFWRQVILWLAKKDQLLEGTVWVRLPKRRFAPAEQVEFSIGAQAANGEALREAEYDVQVVLPDGTRRPLRPARQDQQMTGSFRDTQAAGDYAIEVSAARQGQALGATRARFLVHQQDLELDNAAADPASLESLAAITGGESLAPERLTELVQRLASQTEYLEVQQETKKTFWDRWPFFLMLVGLLGVEWYLRKRWGLV